MDFRPPHINEQIPLEYDWDGFVSVTLFGSQAAAPEIGAWYELQFGIENDAFEPGQFEYYLPTGDRENAAASVLIADMTAKYCFDNLDAYIGSSRLRDLANSSFASVGVVFVHAA